MTNVSFIKSNIIPQSPLFNASVTEPTKPVANTSITSNTLPNQSEIKGPTRSANAWANFAARGIQSAIRRIAGTIYGKNGAKITSTNAPRIWNIEPKVPVNTWDCFNTDASDMLTPTALAIDSLWRTFSFFLASSSNFVCFAKYLSVLLEPPEAGPSG